MINKKNLYYYYNYKEPSMDRASHQQLQRIFFGKTTKKHLYMDRASHQQYIANRKSSPKTWPPN